MTSTLRGEPETMPSRDEPIRVVHLLTKQDLGGAQFTALESSLPTRQDTSIELWIGAEDPSNGQFAARAAELGVTMRVVPALVWRLSPLGDLRAVLTIRRMLKAHGADVLQTHSSKAGVIGRLAGRLAGVPVVHTVHGWSFTPAMRRSVVRGVVMVERVLARMCSAMIVVTHADLETGISNKIGKPRQYHLIRSGLRLDELRVHARQRPMVRRELFEELGIDDDGTTLVGSVGRLAEQKDPLLLIEAFELLAADDPTIRLVLVGDGPLRDQIVARIESSTSGRIHLLDARPEGARLIAGLDLFVFTSRWEGLPRTAAEAMTVGTPIAAPAVNGLVELLEDGETGYRIDTHSAASVAAGVRRALDDPDRSAVAARAEGFASIFDVDEMRQDLDELWRQVAGRSAAPAPAMSPDPASPAPHEPADQVRVNANRS